MRTNVRWEVRQIIFMKMNKTNLICRGIAMLASAALLWGCSGNVDVEDEIKDLTLTADVTEITADGVSDVTFSVHYGDEDVTGEASIKCISGNASVNGGKFSSEAIGTYVFRAFYEDAVSQDVEVKVISRFLRRVCVMEFTGTWCAQCPEGATTLNFLISRTYKDKAFALAFHNDDPYALPVEQDLQNMFNCGGYPAYIVDMRDAGILNGGGCGDAIEISLYEDELHSSVSVSSVFDQASGKVNVEAKVYSEKAMEYKLAAYVIEDRIIGEQAQADGSVDKEYMHRHVVRSMLSSSVRGDDLGNVAVGKEAVRSFTFTPDAQWKIEDLSVAVLAIDADGHVNNMAICAVDGGRMEYGYVN